MILKMLLWFTLLISISEQLDFLRPKTVRITKLLGKCPGYENVTITYSDIHITMSHRTQIISLKIDVSRIINEGFKIKLFLKRCQSREALDTCEKYQTITMNHMCDLMDGGNKPWTPFIDKIEPKMRCPVQKGQYVVKNGTFDGSAFARFPVSGWYWIVTVHSVGETTNQVLMCMVLEGQIV